MRVFKPHPDSLVPLVDTVAAYERALALWGFLETTHQQLHGNAKVLSPTLQAIVEANRQEVETVLAIARRLEDEIQDLLVSFFDDETPDAERDEAVAWTRRQLELEPAIEEHLS